VLSKVVLGGGLAAHAVMALKDDGRVSIEGEDVLVCALAEESRAADGRNRALFLRAHVDELDLDTALDQRFQLRRRDLRDRCRRSAGRIVAGAHEARPFREATVERTLVGRQTSFNAQLVRTDP
jgi:hypothetical protein